MKNPDKHIENRHTGIIADTGSGKSAICEKIIPARGVRAVFWDPNEDHKATGFSSLPQFFRALNKAHKNYLETGRGFRIAYTGVQSVAGFEKWCRGVNTVLAGDYDTYVVIEELAGATMTAGEAREFFGLLINQGRKYGAIITFTTQRAQAIPKTVFGQCSRYYLGRFSSKSTKKYLIEALELDGHEELFGGVSVGTFIEVDKTDAQKAPVLKTFFKKK